MTHDDPRPAPLTVLGSTTAYENPWLAVREDRFRRPDGSEGVYGVVVRAPFALVVPWDGERFWLVEQWRHPVGAWSLEFPQGGWDPGQTVLGDAAALARTELREETGLTAGTLEGLGTLFNAVGSSDQTLDCWLAGDLVEGPDDRGVDEHSMTVVTMTPTELDGAIASGRLRDSNSVAALALLARRTR